MSEAAETPAPMVGIARDGMVAVRIEGQLSRHGYQHYTPDHARQLIAALQQGLDQLEASQ